METLAIARKYSSGEPIVGDNLLSIMLEHPDTLRNNGTLQSWAICHRRHTHDGNGNRNGQNDEVEPVGRFPPDVPPDWRERICCLEGVIDMALECRGVGLSWILRVVAEAPSLFVRISFFAKVRCVNWAVSVGSVKCEYEAGCLVPGKHQQA